MSNLHKMKRLNAGCGQDILPGYVNMDQLKMKGVDVVGSLDKRLPFKDNTFDEIRCISVLEHVKDVSVTMKEFYRILKKGGKLVLNIPHFTSTNIPSDPTHLRGFSYHTMDFYCGKSFYYDFKFKPGDITADYCSTPYKPVVTVTYNSVCHVPGPIAGFVELPILQFYEVERARYGDNGYDNYPVHKDEEKYPGNGKAEYEVEKDSAR